MFFKRQIAIILAVVSAVCAVLSGCSGGQTEFEEVKGVKFYGFSNEIDYNDYLPLAVANAMLEKYEGIAFQKDGKVAYFNGEFKDISEELGERSVVVESDDGLCVDGGWFAHFTGLSVGDGNIEVNAAAEKIGREALVYKDKLVVF